MRNELVLIIAFSSMFICAPGFAESTSDTLGRIEAETMVLKARERQLEVQAKVLARQQEIAAKQAEHERKPQPSISGNPLVHSIEGLGDALFATLQLSGGALIEVRAGDMLDNGMKVVTIRPNEVLVQTRNKQVVRLGMLAQVQSMPDTAYSGSGAKLPSPPPMFDSRGMTR